MARIARFASQFVFPLSKDGTSTIFPAGWVCEVSDAVADKMMDAGRSAELDPVAEGQKQSPASAAMVIPEKWRDLNVPDTIKLAHDLGAPPAVNTKAEAIDFIAKVEAERAK